jgi:hypothetical protein
MHLADVGARRGLVWAGLLVTVVLLSGASRPSKAKGAEKPTTVGLVILAVAALIGLPVAYRYWKDAHTEDESPQGADLLGDLERAYYAGMMDEAEFRRVRALLIGTPEKGVATRRMPSSRERHGPSVSGPSAPLGQEPGDPGPPAPPAHG